MPTYDYLCHPDRGGCGHKEERFLPISQAPEIDRCPKCGEHQFLKLIGGGGGFNAGTRVEYPYYNWQLPVKPGEKLGVPNVMSRQHENDICAGAINGQQYERNQL